MHNLFTLVPEAIQFLLQIAFSFIAALIIHLHFHHCTSNLHHTFSSTMHLRTTVDLS
ncbi:hypothetical protein BU26DRAFT_521185 [Trematosphaeria pertusa]|uniref:Uncharacterized protein n=1 Tax=Trematosphaeria pertusa TaxID=390896 RepID=A0A6A6I8R1_9PLEO|nr:uncharacterized protein BU26DRAFT_521185 [Trematosphaeria pertusa]KAF2246751.1 hypothetical protein BU26DRAFT_521185 [Trematosphaeria pertusa]